MKKVLSDKQKLERKQKTKKIIKIVFDVLVYTFASVMAIGLLVGGCQQKTKKVGAYYYGNKVNWAMRDINVSQGDTTYLYYYYDSNYQNTWVAYSDFVGSGLSNDGTRGRVIFDTYYTIDNISYSQLNVYYDTNKWVVCLYSAGYSDIDIVYTASTGTTILRPDLLVSIFDGTHLVKINNASSTQNVAWFRLLVWYFGDLGFNREQFTWSYGVRSLLYTFVNSSETEQVRYDGLMIKNSEFQYPSNATGECITNKVTILSGAFRSGNEFWTTIYFNFTSFYGVLDGNDCYYYLSGNSSPDFVGNDNFLKGWFYLDTIEYSNGYDNRIVWRNCSITTDTNVENNNIYFDRYGWVGDTTSSVSPYRDLYFYNVFDSLYFEPYSDFPFYDGFSSPMFLNYWGTIIGHNNNTSGGVPDNTTPVVNIFSIMGTALGGLMPLFTYTIIPGFTIGTLLAIPFAVTLLIFVIKLFKR